MRISYQLCVAFIGPFHLGILLLFSFGLPPLGVSGLAGNPCVQADNEIAAAVPSCESLV